MKRLVTAATLVWVAFSVSALPVHLRVYVSGLGQPVHESAEVFEALLYQALDSVEGVEMVSDFRVHPDQFDIRVWFWASPSNHRLPPEFFNAVRIVTKHDSDNRTLFLSSDHRSWRVGDRPEVQLVDGLMASLEPFLLNEQGLGYQGR